MNTYIFLCCDDSSIDPVAPQLLRLLKERYQAVEAPGCIVGGKAVFEAFLATDLRYIFAPTRTVASYEHPEIASDLNRLFSDVKLISVVNWHAGTKAPDKIFCAHTTGDVTQACFPPASSVMLSAVLRAVESSRKDKQLDGWKTMVEATHWSGITAGRPLSELFAIKAPVIDLEIGSYPEDWSCPTAREVLVEAIGHIPGYIQEQWPSIIFFGGPHFEPTLSESIIAQTAPVNIGPVLPNQWLVQGNYSDENGASRILEVARSLVEPVAGLCFHDNLKSCYKTAIKEAGQHLGVQVFNHRRLRDIEFLKSLAM